MLRSFGSAGTVLRSVLRRPASRIACAPRSPASRAACARPLQCTEAPARVPPWQARQLLAPHDLAHASMSARLWCSVKDGTPADVAREQDSSWKAVFPAVPHVAVDDFSDALLCYGATAVRRACACPTNMDDLTHLCHACRCAASPAWVILVRLNCVI